MAPHSSILCLENPVDGGTWHATLHGVTKSQTQLSPLARRQIITFTFTEQVLEPRCFTLNPQAQSGGRFVYCSRFLGVETEGVDVLSNWPKVTELTGGRVGIRKYVLMALTWASPRAISERQRDGEREGQNKGGSKDEKEKKVRKELKRKEEEQRKGKKRREKNKAQHSQTHDDCGGETSRFPSQGSCRKDKKMGGQDKTTPRREPRPLTENSFQCSATMS